MEKKQKHTQTKNKRKRPDWHPASKLGFPGLSPLVGYEASEPRQLTHVPDGNPMSAHLSHHLW